jgi:hypothetical protein
MAKYVDGEICVYACHICMYAYVYLYAYIHTYIDRGKRGADGAEFQVTLLREGESFFLKRVAQMCARARDVTAKVKPAHAYACG